jgi:hypothetical protein
METGIELYAGLRAAMRHARIALPLAALTLFLAACNRVDSGQLTFWDIFWSICIFFLWVMWIFIIISIFMDIFRRNDLSGGVKAIWIIFLFIAAPITALVYIIVRPKVTAQDVQMAAQAEAANKAVAGVSKADELAKLQALKDAGTINDAQFEELKAKLMAS